MKPQANARWQAALDRQPALRQLAESGGTTRADVEEQARGLGISASTLYRLLQRFRTGGTVESIVARPRGWRAGANRLAGEAERIISEAINGFYLAQPAPTVSELYRDITNRCASAGVPVPTRTTVARRIVRLGRLRVAPRRAGANAAEATTMRAGRYEVDRPNAVWQIDHSPVDVIVVDSGTRQPIGRPWLTLIIDVASRLVPGLYVSLEAPSVVSVGMALRHAVLPKAEALGDREIEADWFGCGLPDALHTDNVLCREAAMGFGQQISMRRQPSARHAI